jgi:hypothetical protein
MLNYWNASSATAPALLYLLHPYSRDRAALNGNSITRYPLDAYQQHPECLSVAMTESSGRGTCNQRLGALCQP